MECTTLAEPLPGIQACPGKQLGLIDSLHNRLEFLAWDILPFVMLSVAVVMGCKVYIIMGFNNVTLNAEELWLDIPRAYLYRNPIDPNKLCLDKHLNDHMLQNHYIFTVCTSDVMH